jgi:AraC family transcriptional regulator
MRRGPTALDGMDLAQHRAPGHCFQRGGRDARAVPKLGQAALARALAAVREMPASGLSVEGLARLAGLSPFHFSRLFRNSTGRSPYRYYEEFRIGRARALLADSRLSIADIGRLLGYADPGQFSRAFRRHVGCPPRAYRRECAR